MLSCAFAAKNWVNYVSYDDVSYVDVTSIHQPFIGCMNMVKKGKIYMFPDFLVFSVLDTRVWFQLGERETIQSKISREVYLSFTPMALSWACIKLDFVNPNIVKNATILGPWNRPNFDMVWSVLHWTWEADKWTNWKMCLISSTETFTSQHSIKNMFRRSVWVRTS